MMLQLCVELLPSRYASNGSKNKIQYITLDMLNVKIQWERIKKETRKC